VVGCSVPAESDPSYSGPATSLVEPADWVLVSDEEDPFAGYRPDGDQCSPDGWGPSDFGGEPAFDVDTQLCDFITVTAPLRADLPQLGLVTVRLWHFDLLAEEDDAEAWLVLAFEDWTLWEERIPIPAESNLVVGQFPVPFSALRGDSVVFHLQNHGSNSYHLLEVSVTERCGPGDASGDGADRGSGGVSSGGWTGGACFGPLLWRWRLGSRVLRAVQFLMVIGGCVGPGEDTDDTSTSDTETSVPDDLLHPGCPTPKGQFASISLDQINLPVAWDSQEIDAVYTKFRFQTLLAEGDLDGDGLPELVVSLTPGPAIVLHNDGECGFSEWADLGQASAVRVVDIDGDGDQDVLLVIQDHPEAFTDDLFESIACVPDPDLGTCLDTLIPESPAYLKVLLNDGSGTPEALMGQSVVSEEPINACMFSTGPGEDPRELLDVVFSLHTYDLDGDGRLEIVAAPFKVCGTVAFVYTATDTSGELTRYAQPFPECRAESGFDMADISGDGLLDVVCVNSNEPRRVGPTLYKGLGEGEYEIEPFQNIAPAGCPMGVAILDDGAGTGEVEVVTSAIGDLPRYILHEVEGDQVLFLAGDLPAENGLGEELVTWSLVTMEDGHGERLLFAIGGRDLPNDLHPQHSVAYCGDALVPCTHEPAFAAVMSEVVLDENLATLVDIDGDGDQDVVITTQDPYQPPIRILVNGLGLEGEGTYVLVEALVQAAPVGDGDSSAPVFPAFGGSVVAEYSDGRLAAHQLTGGSRHGAASTAVAGLAVTRADGAVLERFTLHWPDGSTETVEHDGSQLQRVVHVQGER